MMAWSYKTELAKTNPARVNDGFFGGVFGCPGCYFEGAPIDDHASCRPLSNKRCRKCWSKPYQQERLIPDD